MCLPAQCGPHKIATNTIGSSSFTAISFADQHEDHSWLNHPPSRTIALQPKEPDASEKTCIDGSALWKSETPFHSCKKNAHHAKSALVTKLKRMWWYGFSAAWRMPNSWRRKRRPGQIATATWLRCPRSDSSSRRVQFRLVHHLHTISLICSSFSWGSLNWNASVSSKKPKKVTWVDGSGRSRKF